MKTRIANKANRTGYTLIEVLIVVVAMGIAGAVVIPSMGGAHVLKVQAAVRSVVAD
ncbi:MAG: type II secretion system protein, partial [Phycisphaerales bacterium]